MSTRPARSTHEIHIDYQVNRTLLLATITDIMISLGADPKTVDVSKSAEAAAIFDRGYELGVEMGVQQMFENPAKLRQILLHMLRNGGDQ